MDSPERVSRVIPPRMTKLNTQAAHPKSHIPTAFCA
uniref:COX15 n=1 Tax=Arundo donax TaxID=35708 RepID=A0A0A9FNL3_ARUDO